MSLVGSSELNWMPWGTVIYDSPALTHSPWRGGFNHLVSYVDPDAYYLHLADAEYGLPIPAVVRDLYRVHTWRLVASFVDPYDTSNEDRFNMSGSFDETFRSGTIRDVMLHHALEPVVTVVGTPWADVSEALYIKRPQDLSFLDSHIGSVRVRSTVVQFPDEEPPHQGTPGELVLRLAVRCPLLRRKEDGSGEWVLPVDPYWGHNPPSSYSVAGFGLAASDAPTTIHGRSLQISGFDGSAGEPNASYPSGVQRNGWTITLSVDSYF